MSDLVQIPRSVAAAAAEHLDDIRDTLSMHVLSESRSSVLAELGALARCLRAAARGPYAPPEPPPDAEPPPLPRERSLIVHDRDIMTFAERLIFGEALRRFDARMVARIQLAAIARLLALPADVLRGDHDFTREVAGATMIVRSGLLNSCRGYGSTRGVLIQDRHACDVCGEPATRHNRDFVEIDFGGQTEKRFGNWNHFCEAHAREPQCLGRQHAYYHPYARSEVFGDRREPDE